MHSENNGQFFMVSRDLGTISEMLFSAAFYNFVEEEEEKVLLLPIGEEIDVEFTKLE